MKAWKFFGLGGGESSDVSAEQQQPTSDVIEQQQQPAATAIGLSADDDENYAFMELLRHSRGVQRIALERARQQDGDGGEGFTAERDDAYVRAELLNAAGCYLRAAFMQVHEQPGVGEYAAEAWPWHGRAMWKPAEDPIRNLEKAGALIAAEIDRLQRARA